MLFNSYIFILLFFPICIAGYYGLKHLQKHTAAQWFLLGMSFWFYAYFKIKYLVIILASILLNYCIHLAMFQSSFKRMRKISFAFGIIFNMGLLIYYKYTDFLIYNVNTLFHKNLSFQNILLPLGLSFFTFQQISFLIDTYRENNTHQYNFLCYASFIAFFPQLIAGPIVAHDELIPQFLHEKQKKLNWDNISKGIYIFVLGLGKKVLVADVFARAVTWGYGNLDILNSADAFILMLSYTMQIYFDFSGYCDMAIGIGKILNIDLPINFNSPYKALTIRDFWKRWHITLTRFFTKYIYIPLGGNREGQYKTCRNILIVFFLSGLWHGASWTFVFWGVCHGVLLIINKLYEDSIEKIHPVFQWIITFSFINVMWVFFRADTFSDAIYILKRMMACDLSGGVHAELLSCFRMEEIEFLMREFLAVHITPALFSVLFLFISLMVILGCRNSYEKMESFEPSLGSALLGALLLTWCVCSFSGVSTFLYYNF